MSSIVLTTEQRRAIAQRGEELYPQACRGLLLGHRNGMSKQVIDLVFLEGSDEAAGQRYQVTPEEMSKAEQQAETKGLSVIGAFHSHVDQPARPSVFDREQVEPTFSYVIVGIRQGRAHELAAWRLAPDGTAFFQEDIRSA